MPPARTARASAGFTLLEILIVVTIIGVLMAIVAPRYLNRADDIKKTMAAVQLKTVSGKLELYRLDNGTYPTTEQGLDALVSAPISAPQPRHYAPGGYVDDSELVDPWRQPLVYRAPGEINTASFDLCSLGSDGQPGGEGFAADICNHREEPKAQASAL